MTIPLGASADFFVCEEDARPLDGDYIKFSIVNNESGTQDALLTILPGGLQLPGHTKEPSVSVVATNLNCVLPTTEGSKEVVCFDPTFTSADPVLSLQSMSIGTSRFIEIHYQFEIIALFQDVYCN